MTALYKKLYTIFGLFKIQKDRLDAQIKEFELMSFKDNVKVLDEAKVLAENGEFDKCWQYLHQVDLLILDEKTQQNDNGWFEGRKISLLNESAKFDDKRKKTVEELLKTLTKESLREATVTRNKYYDTHYHKIAIRSKNISILIVLLLLSIALILGHSIAYEDVKHTANLLKIAIYGLLGAVLSMALTLTSKPLDEKIPDLVIGIRVTWLRPIIGVAAAIVSLMIIDTDVLKNIFSVGLVKPENATLIAFFAGFSERFIVSVVDILAKKS